MPPKRKSSKTSKGKKRPKTRSRSAEQPATPTTDQGDTTTQETVNDDRGETQEIDTRETVAPENTITGNTCTHSLYEPKPVDLAGDSLGTHITGTIREKIQNGEFIDLALLLDKTPEGQRSASKLIIVNGELVSQPPKKIRIGDIGQWTDAFLIFMSIYLETHPNKTQQLLKYVQTIRLAASRSNEGWRSYDEQFRVKKTRNPSGSWGEIDSELWLLYIHVTQNQSNTSTSNSRSDRVLKCYDFNYKGICHRAVCPYHHTCIKCGQEHSAVRSGCHNRSQAMDNNRPSSNPSRPFPAGNNTGTVNNRGFSQRGRQNQRPRLDIPALGFRSFPYQG